MKNVSILKSAALITLAGVISACSSTPTKIAKPPALGAAIATSSAPTIPQIVETTRGPSLTLDDVLFDFEQSSLRPEAHNTVEKAASYLRSNPERIALVEGHTDHTGDAAFNQGLSEKRSESIKTALMSMGISESRIQTEGFGESNPTSDNSTLEGRQANRRVEVIFIENN